MPENSLTLPELGCGHFFQQQLSLEEWETTTPVRVFALNRHLVDGVGERVRQKFALPHAWLRYPVEELPTVGDWLLIDGDGQPVKPEDRSSYEDLLSSISSDNEIKMPDIYRGKLMVFKVFDKVSLGLILINEKPVRVKDKLIQPNSLLQSE